ncbi:universal stress protein [Aciditerrimonas ferrireducens]|uniref:universal stress protein n=1 Tax=Aciditerrimonas ferrireducens TaxID=667306 RepID=UPI0020037036|nr:universal stress protein [Aciditerrimonas ferrireducens]MCK4178183.1 universal stress protein [Aciditerrimonas ferrireducens]
MPEPRPRRDPAPTGVLRPLPRRHVLVGTDGSPTASEAVRRAASLAGSLGARLTICCVYSRQGPSPAVAGGVLGQLVAAEEPVPPGPVDELAWRVTRAAEAEEVVRRAAGLAREAGAREVAVLTRRGDAAAELVRLAGELPADLVVVGSRGMRSWTRFVLGSVPNHVSHHAPCDVLIVRTD